MERILAELKTGLHGGLPEGLSAEEAVARWRTELLTKEWGRLMMGLVDSEFLGQKIVEMVWSVKEFPFSNVTLLTSDKPVVMSNGFAHSSGNISLALGPRALFLATNNVSTANAVFRQGDNNIIRTYNARVAEQAQEYVYSTSDRELQFVEGKLRRRPE